MKRFRIIDIKTPWLWLVIFYRKQYGKPMIEVSLYRERRHETGNWWFYWLTREDEPPESGQVEFESNETWSKEGQRLTCHDGHSLL